MKNYLGLIPRYLSAHGKRTRLIVAGVAISVALITGVFSMLDYLLRYEKIQALHDYGNYHILIDEASAEERAVISSRIEVKNAGRWKNLGTATINHADCLIGAIDPGFAANMNITLAQGRFPVAKDEVMLEEWTVERLALESGIGDTVTINLAGKKRGEFVVSGIYHDIGTLKAKGLPGVFVSMAYADEILPGKQGILLLEFKRGVNIRRAEREIKEGLGIAGARIGRNNHLLAAIGQSDHKAATGFYTIGAILFLIVLVAGIVMIYNTFNISVMERVRQFGLLRCIGASRSQIKRMVKREGLSIAWRAIPLGVLAGMLITMFCSTVLKYHNTSLFGAMPVFALSVPGIGAGIAVGLLTVLIAASAPARKAARVSPVSAVLGSNEVKIRKDKKRGLLTRALRVEVALGINNAVMKKKTLSLMSCSIAFSIVMFLGFQVLVDFMHTSMKTTKPYTPDVSLVSKEGIAGGVYRRVAGTEGVLRAYGRMFSHVEATFAATRLTAAYQTSMGGIEVGENGLFVPKEPSWLISYDHNQLAWARDDLLAGTLDEDTINKEDGVIAVVRHVRKGVMTENARLALGDQVHITTPAGTRKLSVVGILRTTPFSDAESSLTTFITTEKLFTALTGESAYEIIDIQMRGKDQERTVRRLKDLANQSGLVFLDARQKNAEIDQAFFTIALFVFGFVALIAVISVLNIVNTMNMSIAAKTRYLGVMRAVGMSGAQLGRMVLAEAATYSLMGLVIGSVSGIWLHKLMVQNLLRDFRLIWRFPLTQVLLIVAVVMLMTVISVVGPLRRIKAQGISEVVNSL
ncbi:MAG: ABC transporter permease [Bacteroidota bacterium]